MSFLNLMGNKLKPKEVNEVLEELTNAIEQLNNIVSSLQTPPASSVTYNNTSSGLTADDVQSAIDEIAPKVIYTYTPDGEKTLGSALDEMYNEISLSTECFIFIDTSFFACTGVVGSTYYFGSATVTGNTIYCAGVELKASGSKSTIAQLKATGNTFTDNSDSTEIGFTVYKHI